MNDQHSIPMTRALDGRVAIVTGAGSRADGIGNGRATAILLARDGARVLLVDAVAESAEATRETIAQAGGEAMVVTADVSREADCQRAVTAALARWQRLDILVNNVGISGPTGTAIDVDIDAWDAALRINVTSMMLMARHAIPAMLALGKGSIVNVASISGMMGGHPSLLYPTTKGAVINMTRAMAAHHGSTGIRVNCVAPGAVYTPMVYTRGMTEQTRDARRRRSLLQTEGTGWDVGRAVRYLAGDEAGWVTGVVLPVDGGATAGRPPSS